jgi:hypothetical protein
MISYDEWRIAYAKQAAADLRAREKLLEHPDLPDCQLGLDFLHKKAGRHLLKVLYTATEELTRRSVPI